MVVDLTKAVQWWQEEQLRILVLASLVVQLFLIASTSLRKYAIWSWVSLLIWVAYLGCDALAIYALATLFNRHREQGGTSLLVLLWAPILLMHIGGHGDITAYNIEDNELWMRLVVTAWSQITVAVYVFCKSWPAGGDRMLLGAAILLFLQGAEECMNKASRLRFGTVDGLVMLILDRKEQTSSISDSDEDGPLARFILIMPMVALALFHKSHKEGYSSGDVKVTYVLFACTGVFHLFASLNRLGYIPVWPQEVAQYSLIGFFMKRHDRWVESLRRLLRHAIALVVIGRKYTASVLKRMYRMDPAGASSSRHIIKLVREHLEAGWKKHIHNATTYRTFNDRRGPMALEDNGCDCGLLRTSLMVPFDESVLLWHIATDLCFYNHRGASYGHQCALRDDPSGCTAWCKAYPHHHKAARCREISNYMVHLLYENSEMLMVGARRNLFWDAYQELLGMFKKESTLKEEKDLTQRIMVATMEPGPVEGTRQQAGGFIKDARNLAEALLVLGDDKMWEVIQGVWVEMLCFSAGRCRGYLHAKALGTGGEFLSYIWLMMSYMGMETLAERMQRAELSGHGGNTGNAPKTPDEPHTGGATPTIEIIVIEEDVV
ncbi:hypothetical protein HU200_010305 [Digitaria exilis]|uniref:DUF4220 domain-containing protein n=1 Tax=Digitaria exilis TaxID=1010633 RepID=A0A835FJ88_9POAL|nr:hypothetical protein HU200_010305 [Digitaria exilis]